MAFTGRFKKMHIMAWIFSMDNQFLAWKTPLLVGNFFFLLNGLLTSSQYNMFFQVFGDILPETSKSSACWDMVGNSHLTWLSSDSLLVYALVYRTGTWVYVVFEIKGAPGVHNLAAGCTRWVHLISEYFYILYNPVGIQGGGSWWSPLVTNTSSVAPADHKRRR